MWRARARQAAAAIGLGLATAPSAIAGALTGLGTPPAMLGEHAPDVTVRTLRGLAALDRGYPVVRWARRASFVPASTAGNEDGGGLWLRLGHNADGDAAVPGPGRRLHTGCARLAAPFPFFTRTSGDDFFGQLWLRVGARAGIRAEYHVIELGDPRGAWSAIAGHTATGDGIAGRPTLAHVLGVGLVLALSDHVGVEAQYGHALGPALADPVWPGGAAHYGYLELSLRY